MKGLSVIVKSINLPVEILNATVTFATLSWSSSESVSADESVCWDEGV